MRPEIITPPAIQPVTLIELKEQASIDHAALDTRLESYIRTATSYIESYLDRPLITQTRRRWFERFTSDEIELDCQLQSVTHVKYYSLSDVEATYPSAYYYVDSTEEPGEIKLKDGRDWPTISLRPAKAIEVQYICGYGATAESVPEPIRQAILMLAASYVRNREAETSAIGDVRILSAYQNILSDYRIQR